MVRVFKKFLPIILFLILLPNIIYTKSRYFSDGDELQKRPKVLFYNFYNLHPAKKHNQYTKIIPKHIISKLSADEVESKYLENLPSYKIDTLKEYRILASISKTAKAYKKDFALIGEYKIVQELNKSTKKILVTITLYDTKLKLILLTQKFAGYSGLGYYQLIDKIALFIEKKLARYKNDMENIVKQMQYHDKKPLQENKVIECGIGSHMHDPTHCPEKGSFYASIMPNFTILNLEFSPTPMKVNTLAIELDLSYGVKSWFQVGIDIVYIYFSDREGGGGSSNLHFKNRVINPIVYFKFKLANQNNHGYNLTLKLEFQPNISEKSYSTSSYVMQFPTTFGRYSFEFAVSGTSGKISGFASLKISFLNFHDVDDYPDDNSIEYIKHNTIDTIFLDFHFGGIFQLTSVFSLDLRLYFRKQSPVEYDVKYNFSGTSQKSTLATNVSLSTSIAAYFKLNNKTNIGMRFKYFIPYILETEGNDTDISTHVEINLFFTLIIN